MQCAVVMYDEFASDVAGAAAIGAADGCNGGDMVRSPKRSEIPTSSIELFAVTYRFAGLLNSATPPFGCTRPDEALGGNVDDIAETDRGPG